MKLQSNAQNLKEISTDTLIVGVQKITAQTPKWTELLDFYNGDLDGLAKSGDLNTAVKAITKIPYFGEHKALKRIIFVGLGEGKALNHDELRNAFGLLGKELNKSKITSATIWIDTFTTNHIDAEEAAFLAAEGIELGYFTVANFKTSSNEVQRYLEQFECVTDHDFSGTAQQFELGSIYAQGTNAARDLINLPPNMLTATDIADYAVNLATQYGFEVEVLNKAQLQELGMGGILSVNLGSTQEPRLITLKYKGKEKWEDVIGLVGKGVTYDTGGYSIKPKDGMVGMKGDMGGAAAVLGAMKIIGETKPAQNVVAVIGSTDNMISGDAFKPDDVITMYNGKTVEVLNTDAEGRLVLADVMTYAKQQGANYLIDVATLTGGVIVALGYDKTGALTNNEEFFEEFMQATAETGEFIWRLPLTESDKKRIRKSDVADLNNSPGRDGHMIFAGGFVGEFAEGTPWIHLDIAGPSDAMAPHDLGPKGGTGVMVRTLANYIETLN